MSEKIKVSIKADVELPLPERQQFFWVKVACWWEAPDDTGAHPSANFSVPVGVSEVDPDSIKSITDKAREKARRYLEEMMAAF